METSFPKFVTVRFEGSPKEYTFGCDDIDIQVNDYVVIESDLGLTLARVCKPSLPIDQITHQFPLKGIVKIASESELKQDKKNKLKAFDARYPIDQMILRYNLDMKVTHIAYSLDGKKMLITYVSENRVDFREILKELTSTFKTRIELKQIGPRDKAKMVGGLGVCGRQLCCKNHIQSFDTISISMAKNQQLSLNTSKLSGQCGKLKCCLRYEDDLYKEAKQGLPKLNSRVVYNGVEYKLFDINLVSKQVTLKNNNEQLVLPFSVLVAKEAHA